MPGAEPLIARSNPAGTKIDGAGVARAVSISKIGGQE